jgi:aminoglycoside/choline kinase family phosphotransferase
MSIDQAVGATDALERIHRYLSGQTPAAPTVRIVPLTGDASDRRYFRVFREDGHTIVLALHAGPIEFDALPFANVAALFQAIPLPIPAILGHSDVEGIVGLQDLGDVTLQAHLGAASAPERASRYDEAVGLIARLQRRGADLASDKYLPFRVFFDVDKLTWELDFFVRHFVTAYRGAALTENEQADVREEWSSIAQELASEARVLCHRDYHSRNLMLHDGRLHIIDFQDARMGPDTYDLVSLLRDSYVDIDDREIEDFIDLFLAAKQHGGRASTPGGDRAEFRRRFDLMALQRNLKALGTFGFQTVARGNPVYIQYIPRTLRYARAVLEKYGRVSRLRSLLAAHIEELG